MRVAKLVLVQLEGGEEVFATLLASMVLRLGLFRSPSRGLVWGRFGVWLLQ